MATRRPQQAERVKEQQGRAAGSSEAFTLEELKALVKVLEGTDVTTLRWSRHGHQIVIRRGQLAAASQAVREVRAVAPAPSAPTAAPAPSPAAAPVASAPVPTPEAKPGAMVTSPFVGTFYRSPSPEASSFVEVGSAVKKGQVLCIVEAMKLMNEIEAEAEGKIAEILVANGSPVEFGQPLFRIEPV